MLTFLFVEQILVFTVTTDWVNEVRKESPDLKK